MTASGPHRNRRPGLRDRRQHRGRPAPARRPGWRSGWRPGAVLAALGLVVAACGTTSEEPFLSTPVLDDSADGGGTTPPAPEPDPACDPDQPDRSLAPDLAEDGTPVVEVTPGSYMEEIRDRGVLRAAVGADTLLFGYLNPRSGDLEGFDVEMAKLVAEAIFGNENAIELVPVQSAERIPVLTTPVDEGGADLVVKTMTINCARWGAINFSTMYYQSGQTLLVGIDSDVDSIDEVTDEVICAVSGTTSLANLQERGITVAEVGDWTDCLVEFQQGRVDGVSTDDTILAGLAAQDPNARIVDEPNFTSEPYGIGLPKDHPEFTRFVNAVLARAKADGTWQARYDAWLSTLPPQSAPPDNYR